MPKYLSKETYRRGKAWPFVQGACIFLIKRETEVHDRPSAVLNGKRSDDKICILKMKFIGSLST